MASIIVKRKRLRGGDLQNYGQDLLEPFRQAMAREAAAVLNSACQLNWAWIG